MSESRFDFEQVFGDDYMHFYEGILTPEISDRQAALIATLLDLQPGLRILDCPCGFGRISSRLADRGADVVGIDVTPHFLEIARREKSGVDYRLGDMRELDFEAEFDAIVNVFSSFGYFDDATDKDVLKRFRRALKPGGRLLLELQAAHRMLNLLAATGGHSYNVTERGDDFLIDRWSFDALGGRTNTERTSVRDGKVRRYAFSMRLLTVSELAEWLKEAGFQKIDAYDQDGEPFGIAARRMVVVAR